jgi:hypothetical protein
MGDLKGTVQGDYPESGGLGGKVVRNMLRRLKVARPCL